MPARQREFRITPDPTILGIEIAVYPSMPVIQGRMVRKSNRLQDYAYSDEGAYFVTICTQGKECLFGEINWDGMELNEIGRMVERVWKELPTRFPNIELDQFIVMPNHMHGIITIVGAPFMAPAGTDAINRVPTLGQIIRFFKGRSTYEIHRSGLKRRIWQQNFYEHIVRNEKALEKIREYIANNPLKWELDRENPARKGTDKSWDEIIKGWRRAR